MFEIALAAMDSESGYLPLDYLQGHKDGLEWAAQLAEANHPETGDWLYDDPIELAKAIRKGPDMPPVQPVTDSEPVIVVGDDGGDALSYRRLIQSFEPGTKLYLHTQPEPIVPDGYVMVPKEPTKEMLTASYMFAHVDTTREVWSAMLAAAPQSPGSEPATVPGTWIPVNERLPEAGGDMIVFTDGIVMSGVSYAKKKGFYIQALEYDDDEPVDRVTHWMPLPAAPQEVK
ncbi:TPA: DUF551 domain-containing protein [Klebsiella quasipneumoniae subsp. similipneumoniae]|nr:DUF551 domain-containing protein [Klebsiella quasipneumoniae subsp. similipneumoniae]HBS2796114.1 DUF551 domain-containing protein [Klebsiella quasipneumoniae subsp. similipneumoniae]HBS2812507.1 DUF551 domain-containing protein [Klebsiella quasipneumoniae subsp. similipneumoniae]